jgi:predicted metal-binding membrane protein
MLEARRNLLIVGGGLAAVVVACWAWQVDMSLQAPANGAPSWQWTPGAIATTFSMWCAMMVAMMLPTAAPYIWTYWNLAGTRTTQTSRTSGTIAFVVGYLISWAVFSAAATLLQIVLDERGLLSPNMAIAGTAVSGVVALGAGIYQFTPMKLACVHKCRTPIGFFVARWRDGAGGAMAVGIEHGMYCVGCCWMLMATMFVAGIMSLAWMAILTAIMLVEKLPSIGERFGKAMGWVGIAVGIVLIAKSFVS